MTDLFLLRALELTLNKYVSISDPEVWDSETLIRDAAGSTAYGSEVWWCFTHRILGDEQTCRFTNNCVMRLKLLIEPPIERKSKIKGYM